MKQSEGRNLIDAYMSGQGEQQQRGGNISGPTDISCFYVKSHL